MSIVFCCCFLQEKRSEFALIISYQTNIGS